MNATCATSCKTSSLFPRRSNSDPLAAWIDALSAVRLGLTDPSDVEASSGDLDGFADAFDRYRSHLNDNNLLDFDEQIYRAIEVLLQRCPGAVGCPAAMSHFVG